GAARRDEPVAVTANGLSAAGNWGLTTSTGRRFALTGTSVGLSIVEVTDPANPRNLGVVPGAESQWREVRSYGQIVYVTTEAKTGLDIVDMRNPDRPVKVRTWNETFTSAHTLWIDQEQGLLYANGTSSGMHVLEACGCSTSATPSGRRSWATTTRSRVRKRASRARGGLHLPELEPHRGE